jgi:hypothetical protein
MVAEARKAFFVMFGFMAVVGGLAGAWLLRDRRPGSSEPTAASGTGPDRPRSDLHKELGELGLL